MNVEKLFTDDDKKRIEDAVAAAEARTSGEIVPVVVESSDEYPHVILAGGLIGEMFALAAGVWAVPHPNYLEIVGLIALGFLAGVLAGRFITPFRRVLLGRKFVDTEVYQRAVEIFHESGLASTRDRTGVLVFVSLLEHRVQVLADVGISARAPEGMWDGVVGLVLEGIGKKDLAAAWPRQSSAAARCWPSTSRPARTTPTSFPIV